MPPVPYNVSPYYNLIKGVAMAGSIQQYETKGGTRYYVKWYCQVSKKRFKFYRYKGMQCDARSLAARLLAQIQMDWEAYVNGEAPWRPEKYLKSSYTDVTDLFETWLDTKEKKKPATIKGYRSYYRCWIKPFFTKHPRMAHEIKLDTLDKLLDSIALAPKGKYNVMNCVHTFMDYLTRSEIIPKMPAFPQKADYQLVDPVIRWLPEDRQMAVIEAIPAEHQPIFWWLKYHLRRPSEACALKWEDYDAINKTFTIRRSISARRLVESTKTGSEHYIPCHSEFDRYLRGHGSGVQGFLFTNPNARRPGKRYAGYTLNRLWKAACEATGEDIDLYSGLKHSSCSQYVNDKGLALTDLQVITDHANLDSVRKYAKVEVSRKRQLMERGPVEREKVRRIK